MNHYAPLIPYDEANMYYTHLNTVWEYCATQYATHLENNIKAHFFEYIERYIDEVFGEVEFTKAINDDYLKTPNQKK